MSRPERVPTSTSRGPARAARPPRGRSALVLLGVLTLGLATTPAAPLLAQNEPTVVFLVRHAERAEDGTSDPVISLPGWDRARLLAGLLGDAGLTHLHATDYRRTRGTGRPLADALGLDMHLYDPRDLPGLAGTLRATPGRHLVVGHSNTTPELVAALGGDPGAPIDEAEYDRLYVVTLMEGGASTVLLRFGAPFAAR
jgi:2,3-bisphosphoglycerate-dependent phosphoglycerate mutase